MEDSKRLQELTAEVQNAVDAYAKSDDMTNYKELQSHIRLLQVAACTPVDTLFTFRLQVLRRRSSRLPIVLTLQR